MRTEYISSFVAETRLSGALSHITRKLHAAANGYRKDIYLTSASAGP